MELETLDEATLLSLREQLLNGLSVDELQEELQHRASPSNEALKAIEKHKGEGFEPVYLRVSGIEFVYRSLGRKEWRVQIKTQNDIIIAAGEDLVAIAEAKEDAKEEMVASALLWKGTKREDLPAGAVEVLSDAILLESGFGPPDTDPVKL